MDAISIIPNYLKWHYTLGFKNMFRLWVDFSWFILKFFSISKLLRTLFSPFQRLTENPGGPGLQNFFESLLVNILMRLIGFILRSLLIILGIITLLCFTIVWGAITLSWLALPVLVAVTILYALKDFLKFITT